MMAERKPEPNGQHETPGEDIGVELFRSIQQNDPDKARMYNAIATASINASDPEMPAVIRAALKWKLLAGMAIGEYLATIQLSDDDLHKILDSQPPDSPPEAA